MSLQNNIEHLNDKNKAFYNYMQNEYKNDLRNNCFIQFAKHFYCGSMNIPLFGSILKTCDHIDDNKTSINIEHNEFMMYMKNIITLLDSKMNYTNNEPTAAESITQSKFFKTTSTSTQNGERKSWMYIHNKNFNLTKNVIKPRSIHIRKSTSSNIDTSNKLSKENVELSLKRKDMAEKDFNENIQTKRLNNLVIDNNKGEVNNFKNKNNVTSVERDVGKIAFIGPEDHINQIFQNIDIQMEYISSDEENIDTCEMFVSSTNNEKISHTNESTSILKQNIEKSYSTEISDGTKTKILKNMYYRNSKGETQLHIACSQESLDLVKILLLEGFNPNVKDNAGWTPLHEAVKIGCLDIVKTLIHNGAYLNVPGFEYETPLFTAIRYNHIDIAKILLQYGADTNSVNIFGENVQHVNMEFWSELMMCEIPYTSLQIQKNKFKPNEIVIFLDNVILNNAIIGIFCKQFNAKVVKNILNEKELKQVTHIIVPKTEDNTCNESIECLIGIANGIFIVNQNWILDSLKIMTLRPCEYYEVNGTASFVDSNGPHLSRINKQKLCPKLFDNINIHLFGNVGWKQFSLEHLKKLINVFGAKLLKRMPNPENCSTTITPYHCHNNELMCHVSNIILFTKDSNRLIKYNMKHLKVFHISWFIEAIQKHCIT